ncbi:MAG: hypothetical protein HY286_00225 [Planctomycetes bacterium]|nr:hypothetical protein [Planctomycetota bacterium]
MFIQYLADVDMKDKWEIINAGTIGYGYAESMRIQIRTRSLRASLRIPMVVAFAAAAAAQDTATAPASRPSEFAADRAALLEGVAKIASPGVPGSFCIFGEKAFVVVGAKADKSLRAPVVAAARAGSGRIVAFAHGGFLGAAQIADTGRLLQNAIQWTAAEKHKKSAELAVGVFNNNPLAKELKTLGFETTMLAGEGWISKLSGFDVLVADASNFAGDEIDDTRKFVESGGGLITSGLGWGWLQLHHGKTLEDYPANHLLRKCGIVFTESTVGPDANKQISVKNGPDDVSLLEATGALDRMMQQKGDPKDKRQKSELAQAAYTMTEAARALPEGDLLFRPKIKKLLDAGGASAIPTVKKPLGPADAVARCLLAFQLREIDRLPAERVEAHPAAAEFPGSVPADAKVISVKLTFDCATPGWQSTGLYAAPGAKIKFTIPANAAGARLAARIGCHTDQLWQLESWSRAPEIARRFELARESSLIANAFGGPVYLEAPNNCKIGEIEVSIDGAVAAPRFVLGKTTNDAWRSGIRDLPAPWAELESDEIKLSIPSAVARKIDDPETLMKYWVTVSDGALDLYGRPRGRERAERYVADAQISAGYMHSGYPIMTHLDGAEQMTDLTILKTSRAWGIYHELGHNHQEPDWTFDGTGEVTNNIFSMYAIEAIAGASVKDGDRSPEKRAERLKPYFAAGAPFEKWKSEPFLALDMYIQIREAFGWDIYKKVFAEYRSLKKGEHPANDQQKRDQWMVRLSKTAGKNLGPFFVAWGVPVTDKARESIQNLPQWMPADFPPK